MSRADSQDQRTSDTLVDGIFLQQIQASPTGTSALGTQYPSVTFIPIAPQIFNRYDRCRYIERVAHDYVLHPVSRVIHRDPLAEWIPHEHPEGALYFRHIEKNVFTDVDLYDPAAFSHLAVCMEQILRRPHADSVLRSGNVDLVLDILTCDKAHLECAYYFVDHAERLVFWIDDFRMSKLKAWRAVPGITTATHVRLGLEIEYWQHVDYFPSALPISGAVLKTLRSLILFGITDTMTSLTTTSPFPTEHMFRMLSVVETITTDIESVGPTEVNTATLMVIDKPWGVAIGRFMIEFARTKFYNFNGEPSARLDSTNSVYGPMPEASYPFIFISPLLFNSPRSHLTNIHTMYKDGILNCMGWKHFIRHLRSEWQETILFGTLILNANVGFLAISSGTIALEPPAQTLSYISGFFGLGSIMTGMFLSRQYGEEFRDAGFSPSATVFFARRSVIGFQSLAMLYSLPYAFIIWGMITFLLAFFTMAVQSITGASRYFVVAVFTVISISAFGHLTAENVIRFARGKKFPRIFARRVRDISAV